MKRITVLVAGAAAFGLGSWAEGLGPVVGAGALVVLAMMLALAVSGTVHLLSAAAGAAGAFAAGLTSDLAPALAGAVLVAACYAERTVRVRDAGPRLLHLGAAVLAGAAAGALTAHYLAAPWAVRGVVIVVCAVMVALPLLVEADDPLAHTLDDIASQLSDPSRTSLREGAALRRAVDVAWLDGDAAEQVRSSWSTLLKLARARERLERSPRMAERVPLTLDARKPLPISGALADHEPVTRRLPDAAANDNAEGQDSAVAGRDGSTAAAPGARASTAEPSSHTAAVARRLDDRIAEHVTALRRAFTAADAAKAAEVSLDDRALRSIECTGESLEQVSRAIVEEV
jgi:hypothetical protein